MRSKMFILKEKPKLTFRKTYSTVFSVPADTYSGNKSASLLSLKISALARQRRKVESVTIVTCCKFMILFKLDLIEVMSVLRLGI